MKPISVRGKSESEVIEKMKTEFKNRDLDWDNNAVSVFTDPNIRTGMCEFPYVAICFYGDK